MEKIHLLLMMMISHFRVLVVVLFLTGCTAVYDLTMNTAAGALGNMLDRRVEDKLGNDANMSDEKLDGKMQRKILICYKKDEDRYYECEDSKVN